MAIVRISDAQDGTLMWDIPLTPKLQYINNMLFFRQAATLQLDVERVQWMYTKPEGGMVIDNIDVKEGEEVRSLVSPSNGNGASNGASKPNGNGAATGKAGDTLDTLDVMLSESDDEFGGEGDYMESSNSNTSSASTAEQAAAVQAEMESSPSGNTARPLSGGRVEQIISNSQSYSIRKKQREARMEASNKQSFTGLFIALGFIVVPPAVLLGIAFGTGYLDQLYNGLSY